jgi:archaellum component FlaF (FlaF/FlaG flagellin family)/regulator of replication initiation timing
VKLSVVSGRPISFLSLLDTPRYGRREVAELPEDRAAGPVVYAGNLNAPPPSAPASEGVVGGVGVMGATGPAGPMPKQFESSARLGTGAGAGTRSHQFVANQLIEPKEAPLFNTVQGATGATLGELFEYHFAGPITIKKNQSAMLPFLKDRVAARKLLIYSERDGEHPVNAAEVTNDTSKTLDGGPMTVYDGGAYAGEALFETVKSGDKRLIGYAVDYGTRVTSAFDSGSKAVREIHAENGLLRLRSALLETRTYSIKNVDAQAKTLIVQQEGAHEYSVLSPQPAERTATAYRFEVKVPANGSQTLKVEQERVLLEQTVLSDSTPEFLLTIVQNKELSATGRTQLETIVDLKRQLAKTGEDLNATKAQIGDLTDDQTRLRQNIDSLNRVKGEEEQVRKYSSELAANEAQLAKLRDQSRDSATRKSGLEMQLRSAIEHLNF